jgi:hypothetical protein
MQNTEFEFEKKEFFHLKSNHQSLSYSVTATIERIWIYVKRV